MQDKVVWKEGLFIRPQHFQQNDRYVNNELRKRTINSRSNAWGLFYLNIDKSLLNTGQIIIDNISGILPDGTLFEINSSKSRNLALNIKTTDTNKYVYLVLPAYVENNDDVHFEDQKDLFTRYVAKHVSDVPNTNAGENSLGELVTAQYNFKLVLEENLEDVYIKMPICKIEEVSINSSITLDSKFIPTFLHISASKQLMSKTQEIVSMLSYRAEKLGEKLSYSSIQASELGNYLMLQLLNNYQSKFHFLLTQDRIHPDELYVEFLSLASQLAVFMKKEKKLSQKYTYRHEEQSVCFDEIINELKSMLTMVLEQHSISIPIQEKKYGIHVGIIKDKETILDSSFVFAINSKLSSSSIKDTLLSSLKIGTVENIKKLVNFHLVGFKIKSLSSAPKEIPYKTNHMYFKIELSNEDKKELVKSGGFAFHLSSDIKDVSYAIWAIKNK